MEDKDSKEDIYVLSFPVHIQLPEDGDIVDRDTKNTDLGSVIFKSLYPFCAPIIHLSEQQNFVSETGFHPNFIYSYTSH